MIVPQFWAESIARQEPSGDRKHARLTPKPWRIGISDHMRPRPGVWPVAADKLPLRQDWVRRYEIAAAKYASCGFMETLGRGGANATAEGVRKLHDQLCHALEPRPLA